ncbi:hypothetical protein ABFX02_04G120300 [Erythranthe guttata]
MERKGGDDDIIEEEVEKVQSSKITINGNKDILERESDDESILIKREIASHSLYSQLVHSHLDCLKLCYLGKMENIVVDSTALPNRPILFASHQSELDHFMEAYCMTLKKVKERIEEPQQESMAFIDQMYSQLGDLLIDFPSSSIHHQELEKQVKRNGSKKK